MFGSMWKLWNCILNCDSLDLKNKLSLDRKVSKYWEKFKILDGGVKTF